MKIGPEGQKNDKMDTFPGEKVLFITGFAQLIFWFKFRHPPSQTSYERSLYHEIMKKSDILDNWG